MSITKLNFLHPSFEKGGILIQGYSAFGLDARTKMLEKKITLTALAKDLRISCTYVSEILKGTREGKGYKERIIQILEMEEK
ncbi:MAG: XRE family transcriptional regulator [Ruminiclostridium sp.]